MTQSVGDAEIEPSQGLTRRDRREQSSRRKRSGRSRGTGLKSQKNPSEPERTVVEAPLQDDRRSRRKRASRNHFWTVVIPSIAIALAITVGIGDLLRSNDDSGPRSGSKPDSKPYNDTLLMAHTGSDGRGDLFALVGTGPRATSVLLIPAATQVEVPSLGVQTLASLPTQGDSALLATAVENMLGVRVGSAIVLDDAALGDALAHVAPLTVDLHANVKLDDETTIPKGIQKLDAATAARVLTVPQSGSELDRLVTVQDVLDGWFAGLRREQAASASVAARPELGVLVDVANSQGHRTDTLAVASVATGSGERFEVRRDDLVRYIAIAFPNALLAPAGQRPRVEILNGTGAVGVAQGAASKLVPAGGEITLTGNVPGFGVEQTQVVYYREKQRKDAQHLLEALGCGILKKAGRAIGMVDVTVIVGADCPAIAAG